MLKILEPLVEPTNYELQFCLSLEYGLIIEHAGDKLSLLLVSCIKAIEAARGWYVGTSDVRPDEMLSDTLNPHENRACSRFDRFIASAKRYPIGRFPIERIVDCIRVARFFCQEAESLIHDIAVVSLRDAINELVDFLSDKTTVGWDGGKYEQTLDRLAENVKTSLVGLRDAFYAFEQAKANPPQMPQDGAKALNEIGRTVLRLDARDRRAKRDKRRRFSIEAQDRVHGIWEKAQANAVLRQGSLTRVTKRQAFDYYRDDLRSLGIKTYEDLLACLGIRSDRLCRARATHRQGLEPPVFEVDARHVSVTVMRPTFDEKGCQVGRESAEVGQEPRTNRTEPRTNRTEPITNRTEPITNRTEPITKRSEPRTNKTEPRTNVRLDLPDDFDQRMTVNRKDLRERAKRIWLRIAHDADITVRDLASECGFSIASTQGVLHSLRECGLLEKTGSTRNGKWRAVIEKRKGGDK